MASASFFVNLYHFALTGKARKASGLKYPIPYATVEQAAKDPAAHKFNCCQVRDPLLPLGPPAPGRLAPPEYFEPAYKLTPCL